MKLKLLSTLLISASVLASGTVLAMEQAGIHTLTYAAKPATPAAPKKVKKAKKSAAAATAAKGSQATVTGGAVSGTGTITGPGSLTGGAAAAPPPAAK